MLKPVWPYGIQLWGCAKPSHTQIIQRLQSKFVRSINKAPWYVSNCTLHNDLYIPLVATEVNPLTPNEPYSGRTAPLTSKRCILYIYSTNICTEYFKHGIYSPFFPLQNALSFIILTYLFPVLFTFYIQNVLKFKK